MHYRSILFVPGNRPDRFDKACAAGADLVCIDLEDAVSLADKDEARIETLKWLAQTSHKNVSLRINGIDTDEGNADVVALKSCGLELPFLMVPKVATKSQMSDLDDELPNNLGVFLPIIESAVGLLNAAEIFSYDRVKLAMFGAVDYSADLDCTLEWESLLYARSVLANAAVAHEVVLFDVPHIKIKDLDDCEASTRRAKSLGIHARAAIHPAQIARIHAGLAPSEDEMLRAEQVIAAYQESDGNVVLIDGKFIEAPVVKKAQRVLAFKD